MFSTFEDMQKLGTQAVEATMQSFTTASKGAQTMATETADFARKSLEQSSAAMQNMFSARTLDRAVEVQSQYAQTAYEGVVAQGAKMNDLLADLAKQSFKPVEDYLAKVRPTA